ncbi:alpha-ketoglutarate-dependent dioxygenase AlkB family protein [Marinoscillum furvescens]|uniref:Uncharacterized protein n=1 Tax=Marinoscillum furvescens DSM 4134 TaxID=1122208 RepID=A0A3D9L0F6_MARFU|nr:hypothetical protein [Marinoscillum furvescens]RED96659.1 hypothetical protein C7460_114117 [Marinoscillum furvescens DSM 4134]
MSLFPIDLQSQNLLPCDGEVYYFEFLTWDKQQVFLKDLEQEVTWEHDRVVMFGKEIITPRREAWYGDQPFGYTYSKTTRYALPWTTTLLNLKKQVETTTDHS